MIYMRLRVDWWVICIYLAVKMPMSIYGEMVVKSEKEVYVFHFHLEIDLHYQFHAIWALLEDFR